MPEHKNSEPFIFISYSHKDTDRVEPIIEAMKRGNLRVWYDSGIEAGTEWPAYIESRLEACAAVVICMSESAVESVNCRNEINYALSANKDILVVYLEETQLRHGMKLQLGSTQSLFVNRHKTPEGFYCELCNAKILQRCKTQPSETPTPSVSDATPNETAALPVSETDAEVQYRLGLAYTKGIGVAVDPYEAFRCFQKAANLGLDDAQYKVGEHYEQGTVVKQSVPTALSWYRKAAEQGHAEAMFKVGSFCYNGTVGKKDLAQAMDWFRKAAERGSADAQCELGLCYAHGIGVARNPDEALRLLRIAAERGNVNAQFNLATRYALGEDVEKNPAEAVKWYRKAAEQGHSKAQLNLGIRYERGDGVEKNPAEAVKWYRKAAEQGDPSAQYNLGLCCENGIGAVKNLDEAFEWYRKAAAQNYAPARVKFTCDSEASATIGIHSIAEMENLRTVAEQGNAQAQYTLAVCYERGRGVKKDIDEAFLWYCKAAEQGHAEAQYGVGRFYELGKSVNRSVFFAAQWYRKAAAQGHENAEKALARLNK